jgi:hypothetical protein
LVRKDFEGCSVPTLATLTACREVGVFYKRWVAKSSETTTQEVRKKCLCHLRNRAFARIARQQKTARLARTADAVNPAILQQCRRFYPGIYIW